MRRPPLWAWAFPATLAAGVVIGERVTGAAPPARLAAAPAPVVAHVASPQALPAAPQVRDWSAGGTRDSAPQVPDTLDWGPDGGPYRPLAGSGSGPLPPSTVPEQPRGAPDALQSKRHSGAAPAQTISRAEAYQRPLIASVQGGHLSFYSGWEAPPENSSLVGEWAAPGDCTAVVRMDYEQAAGGIGAVRGTGRAEGQPPWTQAVVFPRQHCARAVDGWRGARRPTGSEVALLTPLLGSESPVAVVTRGRRMWAASPGRVVVAELADGRATEVWSDSPPDGAAARLLGVWRGEALWVAVQPGGRVVRVWRET